MKSGSLIIYSGEKCMNTCVFCEGHGLREDMNKKFERAMYDANYFIRNEYESIEISGGDPGEFPAIAEIIYYLKKNGIKNVQLSTHGRTLKDKNFVNRLAAAGLNYCKIPLYGSKADIHNKITQVHNSEGNAFNDSVQAIRNCASFGIWVAGHTLITQYNKDDINNIIKLYLRLTEDHMKEMIIGSIGITEVDYNYTGDWYIPFKDMGPHLKEIVENRPEIPEHINFKILDIPYCVLGYKSDYMFNNEDMPDLGQHEIEEKNRAKEDPKIPHYRVKMYFDECEKCKLKSVCDGIHKNDVTLFGTGNLRAIQ